jgi:hypothetical protein
MDGRKELFSARMLPLMSRSPNKVGHKAIGGLASAVYFEIHNLAGVAWSGVQSSRIGGF